VRVHETVPQYGRFSVAPGNFLDWRRENQVFERIAGFSAGSGTLVDGDVVERVSNAEVSFDLFDLLGVRCRSRPTFATSFAGSMEAFPPTRSALSKTS
jgi:hypothetical protein